MDGRSGHEKILKQIATSCRKARRGSAHPRYSQGVKQQVQDLIKEGLPINTISQSTGLSDSVIRKWSNRKDSVAKPPVRVLPVVNDRGWANGLGEPVLMLKANDVEIAVFARRNK